MISIILLNCLYFIVWINLRKKSKVENKISRNINHKKKSRKYDYFLNDF
jgi:hypothetical protein